MQGLDRFGNRWQQDGPQTFLAIFTGNNPSNPQNNNRMDGYSYDAAGNLLSDGTHSYTYDAENRMIKVDGGSTATYAYDPDGHRVEKITATGNYSDPAGTWYMFYDQSGHYVLKANSNYTFVEGQIYAGSRHLASVGGWMTFSHSDWLGTERFRTYMASVPYTTESCTSLPFGDGLNCTGSDVSNLHFTGKERDSESGLDNFGARYNSSSTGRFMSPDPRTISLRRMVDPQQWNMYAYVRNNPMVHVDPDGQELHLVIYNSSGIDKQLMTRVAIGIASKYQAAGVKNVSYEIRQGKPGVLTQAAAELLPTPHSHLLEIRKDKEGSPTIPNGEGGHNWDFGGHSAVDASAVSEKGPKSDTDLVNGLVNVGTHESGHDVLGHQGGDNDIMNGSGEADPNWLFNPNLQFSPGEANALQNKYNSSGEVELTPPTPPPPPPPPCATDKEHPCS
jgi:RHS repeat-associated protein